MSRRLRIQEAIVLGCLSAGSLIWCFLMYRRLPEWLPLSFLAPIVYCLRELAAQPAGLCLFFGASLLLLAGKRLLTARRLKRARGWLYLGGYALVGAGGLFGWLLQVQRVGVPSAAYSASALVASVSPGDSWITGWFVTAQAALVISVVLWIFWLGDWAADRIMNAKEG